MKKLFWFLLLVTGQVAFAQKLTIQGRITDKQSGGLPSASVLLLQLKDSSIVASTLTDTSGRFILPEIEKGNFILKATYVGYTPYLTSITFPTATDTLNVGLIELKPDAIRLTEVAVTALKQAVVVKKDTVEYNTSSFGTRPNANVEQLLKKLPGVEVDKDGSIRVQGENVARIFVDGKEFFGGDLEMATKNLPADAIDKVQVIDGQSEEAQFSGVDDGRRQKVINLTLKEKRRNMGFGRAMAGVGTSGRYVARANYNRFANGNNLSVVGTSNNVNNQGLSADGLGAGGGGQNGLVTTHTGAATMSKQLTRITRINGSYRLNYRDASTLTALTRQNFLPQGTALYYENSQQQNTNSTHSSTAGFEHKGSRDNLRINTSLNFSNVRSASLSSRQSYSVTDTLVNAGERAANTGNRGLNFTSNLFYGHRFGKTGRLFTVTNQISINQTDVNGRSESFTRFSNGDTDSIRQRNLQETNNLGFSMRFAYTEPIGKKQYLQVNYSLSNRSSNSDLQVFDLVGDAGLFNPEQSSRFVSGFMYQQVGLSYRLTGTTYNLSVGSQMQQATLTRRLEAGRGSLTQSFQNMLPDLHLNVRLNKVTRINFNYNTAVREPSINQLQPVVSRYDPLNLYVGNPDLRPEYSHNGKVSFNTVDSKSGLFLSGSVNGGYSTNPIIAAVTIDDRQVRTTQYINVASSSNVGVALNAGFPVKKLNSRFNLGPFVRRGRSLNFLNGVVGAVTQRSVGGNVGYTYTYGDLIDLNLRANVAATSSEYELNKKQNQFFVNSAFMADATVHFFNSYNFTTEFDYSRFRNAQTGFDQAVPMLNLSLSRYILKEDRGEIRLSGINVLNQNVGATQQATLNYIEQATRNTLGSFYMLSFSYKFRKQVSE